jgi:cytochrome c oxidase cbb3-type subunit III
MNNDYDSDSREPRLMEHEADGIRELDNLLPRWWVWLFYLCNAFAVFYMVYYHVLKKGDLQAAEYAKESALGEKIKSEAIARFESALGSLTPSSDPAILAQGLQVYTTLCAPCHRADGGGLVGPNLCDDYWIHGSNYVDQIKVILNGVPEKGMLTWRGVLKPGEIQSVASYIHGFRGTKPPNPKLREDQAGPEKASEYE